MKTNGRTFIRGLFLAWAAIITVNASASPLTWFPGPSLEQPVSGTATAVASDKSTLLLGGDAYLYDVEDLNVTNIGWIVQLSYFPNTVTPGAVSAGGQILIYGGNDGTSPVNNTVSYSTSDGQQTLAPMLTARADFGYAADRSGYAYAIGGLDVDTNALAAVERYDQDTASWAAVAALPAPRYHFPAVYDPTNRFIYIFGGLTNSTAGQETATVLRYSTSGNSWSAVASMPIATAGSSAAFAGDGKIYVVGGTSGGAPTNAVQVYDPVADAWTLSTPLPEPLTSASMGVDSLGRLIFMGGSDTNGQDTSDVWRSQQLGVPDAAPVFTLFPATNGNYNTPYASSVSASGNPQPTYGLMSGPAGMQVDLYSGAITWTPDGAEIGTNSVTIRATNYAGYADYTFNVVVRPPPPTTPTGLTVASANDGSVTLTWTPEDPLVGPVNYYLYEYIVTHGPKGSSGGYYTPAGGPFTTNSVTIYLAPGTSHIYAVKASAGGITTGYSEGISASTTSPQGPSNLAVTGLTSTTVSLAWDPAPGPAQSPLYSPIVSYSILEYIPGVANVLWVSNLTTTSGTVTGIAPGSTHRWEVQAVDAQGVGSKYMPVVPVTNPTPVAPTVSAASTTANGGFQFTLQENGSVLQTLIIEANPNPADTNGWVPIGSVLPASSTFTFTDTNAAQYPTRFYRAVAP